MAQSNFTLTLKTNEALTLAAEAEIDFPLPQPWPKEISADIGWMSGPLGFSFEVNESVADGNQCPKARAFFSSLIGSLDIGNKAFFMRLDGRDVGHRQLIRAVKKNNTAKK